MGLQAGSLDELACISVAHMKCSATEENRLDEAKDSVDEHGSPREGGRVGWEAQSGEDFWMSCQKSARSINTHL